MQNEIRLCADTIMEFLDKINCRVIFSLREEDLLW